MPNFVRACFCLGPHLYESQILSLLIDWASQSCILNWKDKNLDSAEQISEDKMLAKELLRPLYFNAESVWSVNGQNYKAEIFHIWHPDKNVRRITFSVEENAFFRTSDIEFNPEENGIFTLYKGLIIAILQHLKPVYGSIDYEADFLCNELNESQPLASWGNYFSRQVIQGWDAQVFDGLQSMVDSFTRLQGLGVLTFIQPLVKNQAWTPRHAELESFIKKNVSFTGLGKE